MRNTGYTGALWAHCGSEPLCSMLEGSKNKRGTSYVRFKGKDEKNWTWYFGAAVHRWRSHLKHQNICPVHQKQKAKCNLGVKSWALKKGSAKFCIPRVHGWRQLLSPPPSPAEYAQNKVKSCKTFARKFIKHSIWNQPEGSQGTSENLWRSSHRIFKRKMKKFYMWFPCSSAPSHFSPSRLPVPPKGLVCSNTAWCSKAPL